MHNEEGTIKLICANDWHLRKALFPIKITEEGISICVNEEHPKNVLVSIEEI